MECQHSPDLEEITHRPAGSLIPAERMIKMEKISNLRLTVPAIEPGAYENWVALDAVHVVRDVESWLVVTVESGQDNISEESVAYSSPRVEEWANREYDDKEISLSFKFPEPALVYGGRELFASNEEEEDGVKLYTLSSPGCGLITPQATIYMEGIEVPKIILPEIPAIFGIPGLRFYLK